MAKKDVIEVFGTVLEAQPNAMEKMFSKIQSAM